MRGSYPMRDQVAIVGVGTTPFSRNSGRSELSLLAEAAMAAIRDAGLTKEDINGLSGSGFPAELIQGALGIPETTWYVNNMPPFHQQVLNAMQAVFSGACDTVLAYHTFARAAGNSRSAGADPFRVRSIPRLNRLPQSPWPDSVALAPGYASWASRYIHDYGSKREHFGYLALNSRSHAIRNPHAAIRDPMSMDDYLAGRMVRDPLRVFDMDYPVDGADALVITTAERARDLPGTPVLIHAATAGQTDRMVEENLPDLQSSSQSVVGRRLWERSELGVGEMDLFYPYDGFTILTMNWFESVGFCGPGEGGPFIEDNWDIDTNTIRVNGRVEVNTHGGSLSEGASQGSGHIREAVTQLRGAAGERQVPGARTALVTPGGLFFYVGGMVLRTDT